MGFLKRILPAVFLVFTAPLTAEYLLASMPLTDIFPAFIFVTPIYGFGALLIRETVRRFGGGYPAMAALAFSYAAVEEGLSTCTLFNPDWMGLRLLDYGYIPALGVSAVQMTFILSLHVIWSILVPVALSELVFYRRRREPWLGLPGLAVSAVLYAAGAALIALGTYHTERFIPAAFQYVIAAVFIAAGIGLFFRFRRNRPVSPSKRRAPGPLWTGIFSFSVTGVMMLFWIFGGRAWHVPAFVTVFVILAADICAAVYISAASKSLIWSAAHRLALVSGAVGTYCWAGVFLSTRFPGPYAVPLQICLAAAFIVMLVFVGFRLKNTSGAGL